jgi:hypothetical protein
MGCSHRELSARACKFRRTGFALLHGIGHHEQSCSEKIRNPLLLQVLMFVVVVVFWNSDKNTHSGSLCSTQSKPHEQP